MLPVALAALGGLTLLAACGDDDGGGTTKGTEVKVTLSEFKIEMPTEVKGGPTTWTAKNTGTQEHQVTIGKLNAGVTAQQLFAALQQEGGEAAALQMVTLYGAPQSVAPGKSVTSSVDLPEGDYVALCFIPDPADGVPHLAKGMAAEFKVAGSSSGTAIPDKPVVTLTEFKFDIPADVDWSKPVRIDNKGTQPHEIAIYKIADGKSIQDVLAFLGGGVQGPPPFEPAGGITGMSPGTSAAVDLDLAAGKYAFLCFFTDPASGAPHFANGMQAEVTVS